MLSKLLPPSTVGLVGRLTYISYPRADAMPMANPHPNPNPNVMTCVITGAEPQLGYLVVYNYISTLNTAIINSHFELQLEMSTNA